MVSGSVSLPCSGFFSPFPHGTGPLSVSREYLALPDGPGGFTQGSTCPALLRVPLWPTFLARTGLSPSTAALSSAFRFVPRPMSRPYNPARAETRSVWAAPLSLAATGGITLVFSSSGYLDVSVLRVPRSMAMCSPLAILAFPRMGFPIRISTDLCFTTTPRSFSQWYTSFFGLCRLGIHRMPLVA